MSWGSYWIGFWSAFGLGAVAFLILIWRAKEGPDDGRD